MESIRGCHIGPKWRKPEFHAAVLNGALILLVPPALAAYGDYTWEVARPLQPTLFSSVARTLPILLGLAPLALLVMWRSYVHAHAYRVNPLTVWRGPVESAAIAGGLALFVMVSGTAGTWSREPFLLVVAYIAFYVGATALVGLVLGLVLAATALVALHIGGRDSGTQPALLPLSAGSGAERRRGQVDRMNHERRRSSSTA
jgi:hypothetical protein